MIKRNSVVKATLRDPRVITRRDGRTEEEKKNIKLIVYAKNSVGAACG